MATITTSQYLDNGTARTAGETWTIGSNATLTVRTDTRWHADAPASMTGSFGAITVNEGALYFDATDVRWLAYDTGTGNVPAIGTSVTQAGASASYLLGVYDDLTSAPTAVGAAMPTNGFLKFREVTGVFASGALTGIGASATGADVTGWIEVVADDNINISLTKLAAFRTRGDWFYLDDTSGAVGQVFQVPTNGGGANTRCFGLWVEETEPRSSTYTWASNEVTITLTDHGYYKYHEVDIVFTSGAATPDGTYTITEVIDANTFTVDLTGSGTAGNCTVTKFSLWTSLSGSNNAWTRASLGAAYTETDIRQSFVHDIGSGQMQMGEVSDLSATYANVAAISGTYANLSYTGTYTWVADRLYIRFDSDLTYSGLYIKNGQSVHLDFTSGGATAYDGNYTVDTLGAYWLEADLVGSGTGGNVTITPGISMAVATGTGIGETVYANFTSGSGVDGNLTCYHTIDESVKYYEYPHSGSLSGNVDVSSLLRITYTAHTLSIGHRVYLDFTSGGATSGLYTIVAVPSANTFDIAYPHSGAISGNVTVKQTIGHVPAAGLRTRIPNILLRACATGSRETNAVPNATVDQRPHFGTYQTATTYDVEFIYSQWWHNTSHCSFYKVHHFAVCDTLMMTDCLLPADINDGGSASYSGSNAYGYYCIDFGEQITGALIRNTVWQKGGGHNYQPVRLGGKNITVYNIKSGNVPYSSRSAAAIDFNNQYGHSFYNVTIINGGYSISSAVNVSVYDTNYCDRYVGYHNSAETRYGFILQYNNFGITIDGWNNGYKNTIPNQAPGNYFSHIELSSDIIVRNIGSYNNHYNGGTFRSQSYSTLQFIYIPSNCVNVKIQRCYIDNCRSAGAAWYGNNNVSFESVFFDTYGTDDGTSMWYFNIDSINGVIKGMGITRPYQYNNSLGYGNHFQDGFMSPKHGYFRLIYKEPTPETSSQVTLVAGTSKWGASSIYMRTIGDQVIWEDNIFRKGHTGFSANLDPYDLYTQWYTYEYQIDIGSGYSGSWSTINRTNLSAITIDPAVGFKMKIRITTIANNTNNLTTFTMHTVSTAAAQLNMYPLDLITITLTGLQTGSDVVIYEEGTTTILDSVDAVSNYSYVYEISTAVDIGVFKAGYIPYYIRNYILPASDSSLPIAQVPDRAYLD